VFGWLLTIVLVFLIFLINIIKEIRKTRTIVDFCSSSST
jgi:hypothetical protein